MNGSPRWHHYFTTQLCWLSIFELWASIRDWQGARWSRGLPWLSLVLCGIQIPLCARRLLSRPLSTMCVLLFAGPAAAVAQLGLASLRGRQLDPRRRLQVGTYVDRTIERVRLPTAEGAIPALYIRPNRPTSAAVIYLHGSGSDKYFYTWNLMDTLIAYGVALLIPDLDGHGETARIQQLPESLDFTPVCIAWLRQHYQRVGLIGNSLGGCFAARAVADGFAVDALVLLQAPPRLRLTRRQVWLEGARILSAIPLSQLRYGSFYFLIRTWLDTPPIRATISTAALITALDLCGSLQLIGQDPDQSPPVLLAYGLRDAIVPPHQGEEVAMVAPAWATFCWFPQASHLSLTIDPEVLQLVGRWLTECLEPPSGAFLFEGKYLSS